MLYERLSLSQRKLSSNNLESLDDLDMLLLFSGNSVKKGSIQIQSTTTDGLLSNHTLKTRRIGIQED